MISLVSSTEELVPVDWSSSTEESLSSLNFSGKSSQLKTHDVPLAHALCAFSRLQFEPALQVLSHEGFGTTWSRFGSPTQYCGPEVFLKELVSMLKYCLAKFLFSKSFALCDEEEVLYYQKLRRLPRIQVLQMPPASLEQPMRLC